MYISDYVSPIGKLFISADNDSITGVWFENQKHIFENNYAFCCGYQNPEIKKTILWLDIFFNGKDPGFTPKIYVKDTPFRLNVWRRLLDIPFGETVTYGRIAKDIDVDNGTNGMSAQAVGQAVGHNPIALIIPCHRVVGKNNKITGYAAGIDKKMWLLNMEKTSLI